MGSLFDELKKAKLIDKKKAKQLAHESRVAKKKNGGGRAEDLENQKKRNAFEEKRRKEGEKKRKEALDLRRDQEKAAEIAALKQQIRSKALGEEVRGDRRFYFVDEDGFVPFIGVNHSVAVRLEAGELGIVRDPQAKTLTHCLVPRKVALRCRQLVPEWCRFLNGV